MRFLVLIAISMIYVSAAAARSPVYEDFPALRSYAGARHKPILDTPRKIAYRTRLRAATESAPNFAGEFVVTTWGCGTGCSEFAIASPRTGRIFTPSFGTAGGETMYAPTDDKWERIEWRANSRLLIVNGKVGTSNTEPDAHHFYVFDGQELDYLSTAPGKPFGDVPAQKVESREESSSSKVEQASSLPPQFIGRWASTYASCRTPGNDDITRIEAKRLLGVEHGCDFTKLEHAGNSWTAVADCEGEGERWASRIGLTVDGDTLIMQYDKRPQSALLRCR